MPERRPRRRTAAAAIGILAASMLTAVGALATQETADATYASGGSGAYVGAIDWIDWGAAGTRIQNGATATSTREIAGNQLVTACTITNVAGAVETYRSGSYSGDSLDDLYNTGGVGTANTLTYGLVNVNYNETVGFDFSCDTTLNGEPVALGGLVVADAESSNASQGEYVQARPFEQDATWRIIERARTCQTNVIADLSADGTLRLAPDNEQCSTRPGAGGGRGPMAIGFMDGATGASVQMHGGGRSAIALGVVLEADFGDAPESYGAAGSLFERAWQGGEVSPGRTNVSAESFALATPGQPALRLGKLIDSDSGQHPSADATADD
ncbi:MAG TPA: CshA/CshB family fibrillar adhesin-related protein, partial [Microbacterium sp.]|nr:CshA/CshB family fibrillar adhesin-related protein [Microbacterium sp.]